MREYSTANSLVCDKPGRMTTKATVRAKGMRITEKSSDLVLDIWAMISLQQMFANTVPVSRNMQRGSCFRISLGDESTQMKNNTMATTVETRGLMASRKDLFLPVPCNTNIISLIPSQSSPP